MSFFKYLSQFCFLSIEFYSTFYISYKILPHFVYYYYCIFFVPTLLFSILTPLFLLLLSVSLSYFILAVPMRRCLGKHSSMSSPFPIAILNGTFFFRSVKAMNNWKRSAIKQILLLLLVSKKILRKGLYQK